MAIYQYIVLTSAKPGQLEEFEHWYDNQHLQDVVRVPGVKAAKRYRMLNIIRDEVEPAPWNSLAIYELETDDPVGVARELTALAGSPAMPVSDAFAPPPWKIIGQLVSELPRKD